MYCTNCGAVAVAGGRFCGSCGAPLSATEISTTRLPTLATSDPQVSVSPIATTAHHPGRPHAGFLLRVGAWFIDGIIIGIAGFATVMFAGLALLVMLGGGESAETAVGGLLWLLAIAGTWLYFAWMESSSYQATIGKMALGLIVTDSEGRRLSFGRATGRYFAKYLCAMTLGLGYLAAAFTARKQGLHDLVADTLVVVKR